VTFYEIDFEDMSPTWSTVQQKYVEVDEEDDVEEDNNVEEDGWEEDINDEYEEDTGDIEEVYKMSTSLSCCDKTLVLLEESCGTFKEVHLTLWNTENWAIVCELPLEETSNETMKQKYEVSEENINLGQIYSIIVTSDILVFNIDVAVECIDDCMSMALF